MEVLANNPIALSDCGQYFSYCTHDGQLKIWDTLSGRLKQEYTPSSHLSAKCVAISWPQRPDITADESSEGSPKKKRKRKTSNGVSNDVFDLEILALGTIEGSILLYSVVKNDLHSKLSKGHEDRVNDMSWLTANDSLFSCSDDKQVIEWSITTSKVKKKWSPDNKAVTAVCAIDSTNVLVAGNSIKWLDWDKKVILQQFPGHTSEVNRLRHVRLPNIDEVLGSYFLSSAVGDRLVNAWQLTKDENQNQSTRQSTRQNTRQSTQQKASNSLATFSLDDEPISLDITPTKPKQPILVSIVTKSGLLYVFEHILNGRRLTPILPKVKIQITSPDSKKISSKQLTIFSAQICSDRDILLIYGSLFNPVFERISYEKCDKNTVLTRNDSSVSKPSLLVDSGFTKIKSPLKPKNATVMGPAGMAPTRQTVTTKPMESNQTNNAINEVNDKKDTKTKHSNETVLTFEERLRKSEQNHIESDVRTPTPQQPSSDSLTHVLVQGLQSRDKLMLETVFTNTDKKHIRNTLKKLPIDCISLFLSELQTRLFNKSDDSLIYIKWLEQLLELRLPFLMTLPNIEEEFGPLIELMNARTHILDRIYRLKGRLNLMISQIRTQKTTLAITRERPQLDYESSSESSEDEDMDDNNIIDLMDNSDSDLFSEDGREDIPEEDHQSSDESMDEDNDDNLISEDNEEYDSTKVNDIETD